jgi:hypothetical protein
LIYPEAADMAHVYLPDSWVLAVEQDGTRWRTEQVESLELGDDAQVYRVTSLDRPESSRDITLERVTVCCLRT